jgi:hypothetical protein
MMLPREPGKLPLTFDIQRLRLNLIKFVRRASELVCEHVSADQDFLGRVADA